MTAFKRVFKYIWPQWPRVVLVFVCALAIAVLLTMSMLTIIPILKVVIENGLHSWVDVQTCSAKYGIEFSIPNAADPRGQLPILKIDPNSLAQQAGLETHDMVIGIYDDKNTIKDANYLDLLQTLASTPQASLALQVGHWVETNMVFKKVTLATPEDPNAVAALKLKSLKKIRFNSQLWLSRQAQKIMQHLPRGNSPKNTMIIMGHIVVFILITTILRCLAKFYQVYYAEKIVQYSINGIRVDIFSHLTHMPQSYFAKERPSDCVSRITRDTTELNYALKVMFGKALREPLNALFMTLTALWLNWTLTVIFMIGGPFVLIFAAQIGKKIKKATHKSLVAGSLMLAKLEETMMALRVVKVYNQQDQEHERFSKISQQLLQQQLRISKADAATSPVLEVLGLTAACGAIMMGVHYVVNHGFESSTFLTLLMLLGAAAEAIRKSSDIWTRIQRANAAADRIFSLMDEPLETDHQGPQALPTLQQNIEFNDIHFAYPGSEQEALKGVHLNVQAGQTIAIVGPNGSGKSTLTNLLPRFYDPHQGCITIDGTDIREISLASLREQIGMVTQQVVTFNDTIANNIAYGKPDATEEEIRHAAQRAYAHEFIEVLPQGYQTMIGEHGAGLSGGQLQRIVIARAILKNPPILIFDEATSQVDAESEAKIHQAVEEVMTERTTFIIAHRFSTVVSADRIVVMEKGHIVAQGSHEALIKECRLYHTLYETQLVKD